MHFSCLEHAEYIEGDSGPQRHGRVSPVATAADAYRTTAPKAEPPAGGSRRGFGGCHDRFRRSWIEVALPAEHRGPDPLVVDRGDAGPRGVRLHRRRSLERGV